MKMRMRMQRRAVAMRMRMNIRSRRAAAGQYGIGSQNDQNDGDCEFHRETKPRRNRYFENNDRDSDREDRCRMAQPPHGTYQGCDRKPSLPGHDGGHRDHMVGVGSMTHSQH